MQRTLHSHLPWAIGCVIFGVYLLTMSGHTYSADEETMLAVTAGLLESGRVAVVASPDSPLAALRPGRDGLAYSPYGILPSLLAMPLYMLGQSLAVLYDAPAAQPYLSRFFSAILNGVLTAITAGLLAAWTMRLLRHAVPPSAQRYWALGIALAYSFGSFAWPYARTFFSEPLAALLILLAAERVDYAQHVAVEQHRRRFVALFLVGLAGGFLLTTRLAAGVVLPVLVLFILWGQWRLWRATGNLRSTIQPLFGFAIGLLPGGLLLIWYNLARFGTPLASGYGSEAALFTTPLAEGLSGLLFSPGSGIVWYAPVSILALAGSFLLWRTRRQALVLLVWGLFLSHLLLYARWGEWQGGGVWGPRFLLPVFAPLLILCVGLPALPRPRLVGWLFATLMLLGFVANLGAVLMNFNTYIVSSSALERSSNWRAAPILAQWRLIGERWSAYTAPEPYCALSDGWYAVESVEQTVLPRRSGAEGWVECRGINRVTFVLDDRRPPEAAASELRIHVNNDDLGVLPSGQLRRYRIVTPPQTAITVQAVTWNPQAVGFSERADELGPLIDQLTISTPDGSAAQLIDRAIAPLPLQPRARWAWYYDPPNQHAFDLWFWYISRSEVPASLVQRISAAIIFGGWACVAYAGYLIISSLGSRREPNEPHTTPSQMPT